MVIEPHNIEFQWPGEGHWNWVSWNLLGYDGRMLLRLFVLNNKRETSNCCSIRTTVRELHAAMQGASDGRCVAAYDNPRHTLHVARRGCEYTLRIDIREKEAIECRFPANVLPGLLRWLVEEYPKTPENRIWERELRDRAARESDIVQGELGL